MRKILSYNLDISVFIGARSNVDQSNWFWNNETKISYPNYKTSNPSICHQMSWPLTYDDGINFNKKLCKDDAYFLCQIECK